MGSDSRMSLSQTQNDIITWSLFHKINEKIIIGTHYLCIFELINKINKIVKLLRISWNKLKGDQ
jgi:hypothetical protein